MKKAIIIGHNHISKGAYSQYLKAHEFDFFASMSEQLQARVGKLFFHDASIPGYQQRMQNTAKAINDYNPDLVFALHFNAFNGKANGCEAFYFHTNTQAQKLAEQFCRNINMLMHINNRGAKGMSTPSQRGYWEIAAPRPPVLLLEPFFGDNMGDCERFETELFIDILTEL